LAGQRRAERAARRFGDEWNEAIIGTEFLVVGYFEIIPA
jgi:hypothetical protein